MGCRVLYIARIRDIAAVPHSTFLQSHPGKIKPWNTQSNDDRTPRHRPIAAPPDSIQKSAGTSFNDRYRPNPSAHLTNHDSSIHATSNGSSNQDRRLAALHGSSRGPCSSHFRKAQASRWPVPEPASRLPPQVPPRPGSTIGPWPLLADVDVREPAVVLLELLGFGGCLLRCPGFCFLRAAFFAWEICQWGEISCCLCRELSADLVGVLVADHGYACWTRLLIAKAWATQGERVDVFWTRMKNSWRSRSSVASFNQIPMVWIYSHESWVGYHAEGEAVCRELL